MPFEGRQRAALLDRCWSIYQSVTSAFNFPESFHVEKRPGRAGHCAAVKETGVSLTELRAGSRRGELPALRADLACRLVENFGLPLAEVALQLGISTSGVSKILSRSLSN